MKTKYNLFGRGLKLQIAIVISCQCAFVLFGYDQGVFSGIVNDPDWLQRFHHPSSSVEGIIVSIYNLGAFSGTIVAFIFAEKLGRRWCMWVAMVWIVSLVVYRLRENAKEHADCWRSFTVYRIFESAAPSCSIYHGNWNWD